MNELLARDHAEVDELLVKLRAALETADVKRTYFLLDLFWARLAVHIRAEHVRLFPAVLRALDQTPREERGTPSIARAHKTVEELRLDHDFFMRELASAMRIMRVLSNSDGRTIPESLAEVRLRVLQVQKRLALHNAAEEKGIYSWADLLLSERESSNLVARIVEELRKLPPRFASGQQS